jgi:hypothetical protein
LEWKLNSADVICFHEICVSPQLQPLTQCPTLAIKALHFPVLIIFQLFHLQVLNGKSRFIYGFLKLYAVVVSVVIPFLPKHLELKIFTEKTLFAVVI